jgi:hypothetical protein
MPMREKETELSKFVGARLSELHVRQSEFCRITGFDQGLLSKIQTGTVNTFSLESALKLAVGLRVSPKTLLDLIRRPDLDELVLEAYGIDAPDPEGSEKGHRGRPPGDPGEIRSLVDRAHHMGKDLAPIREALSELVNGKLASRSLSLPIRRATGPGLLSPCN